jgi:hypothetical protein
MSQEHGDRVRDGRDLMENDGLGGLPVDADLATIMRHFDRLASQRAHARDIEIVVGPEHPWFRFHYSSMQEIGAEPV